VPTAAFIRDGQLYLLRYKVEIDPPIAGELNEMLEQDVRGIPRRGTNPARA